ncbi:fumarylacetoacetate hydrolase family protein [Lysobacter cavernae]|uniref:Fumarylacetoacetate hydrolase family protein n=1 Tax=Lysobacter cavernae TaxID=1685901 RepID=A0ABV7RMM4_9GAMM
MTDVIAALPPTRVPVRGGGPGANRFFPVHRIYCVGRNFADHAREMGATVPTCAADRGTPVFFLKPTDAIVLDEAVPYPRGTRELHHEVELVVALGRDAPAGELDPVDAMALVFGYAVGLDLTRRDLQGAAKAKGLPWDTGKAFDHSAPISAIVPVADVGELGARMLSLQVNGETRQRGSLADLVWSVPEILHELSKLYALRAGDLVFMGTPAGVGPLWPDDRFDAVLEGVSELSGRIVEQAGVADAAL